MSWLGLFYILIKKKEREKMKKKIDLPRAQKKVAIPAETLKRLRETHNAIVNLKDKLQSDASLVASALELPKKVEVDLEKGYFIEVIE